MKKFLIMFGLALAAGLLTTGARADVDVRIGVGVPGVVIGTNRHHDHRYYQPPIKHHYYGPPVRHRYYGPPVYYYPDKVYRNSHKHYRGKHDKHYRYARPPAHKHLRHGQRPVPPPHARAHGHWSR